MSEIDDGGQAFPIPASEFNETERGMSLRDWFAGQALVGLLAQGPHDASFREHGADAYRFADAMLAARSNRHD